jgi:hypothetical protein
MSRAESYSAARDPCWARSELPVASCDDASLEERETTPFAESGSILEADRGQPKGETER